MMLETPEVAVSNGRTEPQLVCVECGSTAPWDKIADQTCKCGVTPVRREFALSAPECGLRLYLTELTDIPLFHQDGRGLAAREACTACTDCFVCKQPVSTQECVWDEIPLDGLQDNTEMTQQFVYLHPSCSAAYEEWRADYLIRLQEKQADRASAADHREHCITHGLCLECEKPLGLLERFFGRLRHTTCPMKSRMNNSIPKTKKSGKKAAKRAR